MSESGTIATIDQVEDFCWGLTFFGTGGGGRIEAGRDLLAPLVAAGEPIRLTDPSKLPESAMVCWAVIVGGKDPDEPPPADELARHGLVTEAFPDIVPRLAAAVRELEVHAERRIDALVSLELSSAATAATIATARMLGIGVLDGDYVGRAIPELPLTKLELLGREATPVVMIDRWGNRTIVEQAVGTPMIDRIGRMLSRAAYGRGIATVGHLMRLGEARPALVPHSLARARAVGATLRSAGRNGDLAARLAPLVDLTGGRVLAVAETAAVEWRDTQPYTFRELTYRLRGTGETAGQAIDVWVKNEHHVVWRDGVVVATSPDVIVLLDAEDNRPLTTLGEVTPGRRVVVFAMPALDPAWRSPQGRALLGPRRFGFDFDCVDLA
ncbi:DUF917 domain-containing protein [Rhodoplanes roseus]|uniref:DUF917 domain-containing protein n=1 Tax=Rhodoplanes roseus TaxID=29409 RepID=A0A327KZK0_9BRAD|nr:DUF917 domain-containing protein [Rhodoplanes roseus]RAI44129.1 hypothetical protein CH341_10835 [Rhodoplanes roseus]